MISYVGALGRIWSQFLGVKSKEINSEYLESIALKYQPEKKWDKIKKHRYSQLWFVDQLFLTEKLVYSDIYRNNLYKPYERDLNIKTNLLLERYL